MRIFVSCLVSESLVMLKDGEDRKSGNVDGYFHVDVSGGVSARG